MSMQTAKDAIPPLFRHARIAEVDPAQFSFIRDYCSTAAVFAAHMKKGEGLLVSGPSGVGKSHAMAALTLEYGKKATQAGSWHFETVPDVLEKYRDMGGSKIVDSFREQPWTTTYERVRWLVLNDMGKEYRGGKMAEQSVAKLGRLIRRRTEQKLVTHITTNLTIGVDSSGDPSENSFLETYGESLWSLLHECTQGYLVWGPDQRVEMRRL